MNANSYPNQAIIVALGGNLAFDGSPAQAVLESALARFAAFGLEVVAKSRWWRSAAWPDPTKPSFVNGVALVRTALSAHQVMQALATIETEFGRRRGEPNAPRTLDLDLIAHGREVIGRRRCSPPPRPSPLAGGGRAGCPPSEITSG